MAVTIGIAGATGFIGQALTKALEPEFHVVKLTRSSEKASKPGWRTCDLFSLMQAEEALKGINIAVYLVHSMMPSARLTQGTFEDLDVIAADNFARAAKKNGVQRIVFLSGLVPRGSEELSRHLRSRVEVEEVLREQSIPVTVLRAALVVGSQGSSFQIMRRLVERLPLMVCPRWTASQTQPIAVEDVISLLVYCVRNENTTRGETFDIGGPDVMTYRQMMEETADMMRKRVRFITIPIFTPKLSRLWVTLVTGAPKQLVKPLVESLQHRMVAEDRRLLDLAGIPGISFREAARRASQETDQSHTPRPFEASKQDPMVRSVQRMVLPKNYDAWKVGREYLSWLPKVFVILFRTEREGSVERIFLRGIRRPLLVLEFSVERSTPDRALFYIRGGLLSHTQGRGRFEFREINKKQEILAAIHDYRPKLPWYIYIFSQARLHRWVMTAFGRHLSKIDSSSRGA